MIGTWTLVIVTAVSWAIIDGLRKRLTQAWHPWQLLAALHICQLPVLLAFALLVPDEGSSLDLAQYALPGLGSLLLNIAANVMFLEAVKQSPLGLTVPYLALTPLVAAVAALWFGEGLSSQGWIGIAILTFGTGWLHAPDPRWGIATPLMRLREERGSGLMVLVAISWGLTAIWDQQAIAFMPPGWHAFNLATGMTVAGVIGFSVATRQSSEQRPSSFSPWILGTGAVMAVAMVAQFESFQRIDVSVVEAVKRLVGTSSAVLLGMVFYGERDIARRLIASALMGIGAAVLIVSL